MFTSLIEFLSTMDGINIIVFCLVFVVYIIEALWPNRTVDMYVAVIAVIMFTINGFSGEIALLMAWVLILVLTVRLHSIKTDLLIKSNK